MLEEIYYKQSLRMLWGMEKFNVKVNVLYFYILFFSHGHMLVEFPRCM